MIDISDLTVKIGSKALLQNLTLSVAEQEILGVLGASGSGKTSLLRAIAGLNRPCSGEIRMAGRTVSHPDRLLAPVRRRISMVFQSLALWPHMTAWKHLAFVVEKSQFPDKTRRNDHIASLLNMMHLNGFEDRYPSELSGGEQQRLAIARAMASSPECLLMDEPFSSLDDRLRTELLDITLTLRNMHRMTIIYVTHNIDEALYLADRICIMKAGTIVSELPNSTDLTRKTILDSMEGVS